MGQRVLRPPEVNVRLVDTETGGDVDPVLVDRRTGTVLNGEHTDFVPGPAADDRLRRVLTAAVNPPSATA